MVGPGGSPDRLERIPAWIKYAVQDMSVSPTFEGCIRGKLTPLKGIYWSPPTPYVFKHPAPPRPENLRIYESHGTPQVSV